MSSPSQHSESDESAVSDVGEEEFKNRLQECLDDVETDGSFSSCRHHSAYANPGLEVGGIGLIGLPLTHRDAETLARICKQSPYGKGEQTLVDTSVRKTWELDSADFKCTNPTWVGTFNNILKDALDDLGVEVSARAEQYKLLLYEEGAFFKPHRDSEKTPGMFGTLVVCLPSKHSGGEVRLVHGKEERVLKTESDSAFDLSALAWYSDVQHEVQHVTSGFRLVLTYNLVQDTTTPRQSAAALDESHACLERLLQSWRYEFRSINMLVYPLEHRYTDASLCLKTLKGQDAAKGQSLDNACATNGFYWFLSTMTRETEDQDYEGEEEMTLCLDNLVTSSGGMVKITMDVNQEHILAEEFYDGRSPDSEDEGEYTGNEGMNNTYRYHNTVLVLIRKDYDLSQQLTSGCQNVASLKTLFEMVQTDPSAAKGMLRFVLRGAVKELVGKYRRSYGYTSFYGYAGSARGCNSDEELIQFFSVIASYCRSTGCKKQLFEVLQEAMQDPDWFSSTDLVHVIAKQVSVDMDAGASDAWDMWFGGNLDNPTFQRVDRTRLLVEIIGPELPQSIRRSLDEWTFARLTKSLGAMHTYSLEDIPAIFSIIPFLPTKSYFDIILPIVSMPSSREAIARFLTQLGEKDAGDRSEPKTIWDDILKPSYETLLRCSGPRLKITKRDFESSGGGAHGTYGTYGMYHSAPSSYSMGPYLLQFLAIIRRTIALDLQDPALDLVTTALPNPNDADFDFTTPPVGIVVFVQNLAEVLKETHDQRLETEIVSFMKRALQKAADWLIRRRPKEVQSWARATTRCQCAACSSLNEFLRSPSRSSAKFTSVQKTRSHLESQVPRSLGYECVTERNGSPHTLVIYKANQDYCRQFEQWQSDAKTLRVGLPG